MSTRDWVTLIIPIATLILGAGLGFLATSRIEATKWQRQQDADALRWAREERTRFHQQRVDAYTAFLAAGAHLDLAARRAHALGNDTPPEDLEGKARHVQQLIEACDQVDRHLVEALNAYERVRVLASAPVSPVVEAYHTALAAVADVAGDPPSREMRRRYDEAERALLEAIRAELHPTDTDRPPTPA